MPKKLSQYLKQERRRAGFTQTDVALLLGVRSVTKVYRYELGQHLPPLKTALLFEAIFEKPVAELFAGTYAALREDLGRRAKQHRATLESTSNVRAVRRKRSLENLTA